MHKIELFVHKYYMMNIYKYDEIDVNNIEQFDDIFLIHNDKQKGKTFKKNG